MISKRGSKGAPQLNLKLHYPCLQGAAEGSIEVSQEVLNDYSRNETDIQVLKESCQVDCLKHLLLAV